MTGLSPRALITGGCGGAGLATAEALGQRGVAITLVDSNRKGLATAAARLLEAGLPGPQLVVADLSSEGGPEAAWNEAQSEGPVTILVNCAGVFEPLLLTQMDRDAWMRTIEINLTAPFLLSRAAVITWMEIDLPGVIVNVASNAALVAGAGGAFAYGASKAGLLGLTRHMAVDLASRGIRVNAVAPGTFRSPMNAERLSDSAALARATSVIPMGRAGSTSEIAAAVAFLALDGTYVNGETLVVDGGVTVAGLRARPS